MMKLFLIVFSIILSLALHSAAFAETIEDLDAILQKAPTMKAFLENKELLTQYYNAAAKYYGGTKSFPVASFNAIIEQISATSKVIPKFGQQAWETVPAGPSFKIASDVPDSGRKLEDKKWQTEFQDWHKKTKSLSGSMSTDSPEIARNKAKVIFNKVAADYAALESRLEVSTIGKKAKDGERIRFFEEVENRVDVKESLGSALASYLESPEAKLTLGSNSADLILHQSKFIKDNPEVIARAYGLENAPKRVLNSILKPAIPDFKSSEAFPLRMMTNNNGEAVAAGAKRAGEYQFKAIPRRFHGFFKGVILKECVGGDCDRLDHLNPERWANSILKDSSLQYIERGESGAYEGWVHAVPLKDPHGKIVAGVELGSNILRQSRIHKLENGTWQKESFFHAWLREAQARAPKDWTGYVVSQSNNANHSGALPALRLSADYLLGTAYPTGTKFKHIDPMAAELTRVVKPTTLSQAYLGNIVFDTTLPDATTVTKLISSELTPLQVFEQAQKTGNTNLIKNALSALSVASFENPYTEVWQLREAGLLPFLAEHDYNIKFSEKTPLSDYAQSLIDQGFTWKEIKQSRAILHGPVGLDHETNFLNKVFDKIPNAESWLDMYAPPFKNSTEAYQKQVGTFIIAHSGIFADKKPTTDQWIRFAKLKFIGVETWEKGMLGAAQSVKNGNDLITFSNAYDWATINTDFRKSAAKAINEAFNQLLGNSNVTSLEMRMVFDHLENFKKIDTYSVKDYPIFTENLEKVKSAIGKTFHRDIQTAMSSQVIEREGVAPLKSLVESVFTENNASLRRVLVDSLTKSAPELLQHHPELIPEIRANLFAIYSDRKKINLTAEGNAQRLRANLTFSDSPESFLKALGADWTTYDPEALKNSAAIVSEGLSRFDTFSPTLGDKNKLLAFEPTGILPREYVSKEFSQRLNNTVSSADFLERMGEYKALSGQTQGDIIQLSLDHFEKLNPTRAENLKLLKDSGSYLPQDVRERMSKVFWMKPPEPSTHEISEWLTLKDSLKLPEAEWRAHWLTKVLESKSLENLTETISTSKALPKFSKEMTEKIVIRALELDRTSTAPIESLLVPFVDLENQRMMFQELLTRAKITPGQYLNIAETTRKLRPGLELDPMLKLSVKERFLTNEVSPNFEELKRFKALKIKLSDIDLDQFSKLALAQSPSAAEFLQLLKPESENAQWKTNLEKHFSDFESLRPTKSDKAEIRQTLGELNYLKLCLNNRVLRKIITQK